MRFLPVGLAFVLALSVAGPGTLPSAAASGADGMRAFSSEAELRGFLRKMRDGWDSGGGASPPPPAAPPPVSLESPPVMAPQAPVAVDAVVSGLPAAEVSAPGEGITNVQEAGIDEGGIVKVSGDYLVVLRRGRIFTVRHGSGALEPVDAIDAFPPGDEDPDDAWYDEMLVSGDQVVVIGYSYGDYGTEVIRFRLSDDGRLSYRDTHYLRSGDYYSSSNYASRLIGDELILYAPVEVDWWEWRDTEPAIADRIGRRGPGRAKPLLDARRLYVAQPFRGGRYSVDTLHTVIRCDLSARDLECEATAVLGTWSHSFYVARDAVYVWTEETEPFEETSRRGAVEGMLYRVPFDGDAPGAIQVSGGPIDQFSFREDRDIGQLRVLLRAEGTGDAMWAGEDSDGEFALFDLPLKAFGDGSGRAARRAYRPLPGGAGGRAQNRFVGGHLLYTISEYGVEERAPFLYAVPLAGGKVELIELPHGVSRLDLLGADGVAVGPADGGALGFSAIRLDPASGAANLEDTYLLPSAREGEVRSQAFFFRPDPGSADGASGTLGLPVSRRLERDGGEFLGSGSAIAFLRREQRELSPAGELVAADAKALPDDCRASCVDWYGNARPIFLGGRIFALMGYELVEGRLEGGRIAELRRANFNPARTIARRGD